MRMSTDRDDPGYKAWDRARREGKPIVHLDGVRIDGVYTADTDTGYVLAMDPGPDGRAQLNPARDDVLRRELHGVVTIVIEPIADRKCLG